MSHQIPYTPKYNCFYLNQLACHHYKTIHKMRVSFHLVYRYIFCLPSRRLMQIIVQELNIIYSFLLLCFNWVFIGQRFCTLLFFLLAALSIVFFFLGVYTTAFCFIYWHTSHSSLQSQLLQEHTPYKSECSFKEQWQLQLQFLHFVIFFW